jgi:hypothetical protein
MGGLHDAEQPRLFDGGHQVIGEPALLFDGLSALSRQPCYPTGSLEQGL